MNQRNLKFRCQREVAPILPTVHNKKSRRNSNNPNLTQKDWYWKMYRYVGERKDGWMEKIFMAMPRHWLSEDINSVTILSILNNEDCFCFDYIPLEGDNIQISFDLIESGSNKRSFGGAYLSFIYRKSSWVEDFYILDIVETKLVLEGGLFWE